MQKRLSRLGFRDSQSIQHRLLADAHAVVGQLADNVDELARVGVIGDSEHDARIVVARSQVQIDDRFDEGRD